MTSAMKTFIICTWSNKLLAPIGRKALLLRDNYFVSGVSFKFSSTKDKRHVYTKSADLRGRCFSFPFRLVTSGGVFRATTGAFAGQRGEGPSWPRFWPAQEVIARPTHAQSNQAARTGSRTEDIKTLPATSSTSVT